MQAERYAITFMPSGWRTLMKIQAKSPKRTVTRGFASRTAESAARAKTLPLCTRTPRRANMCAALLDGSSRMARAWIRGSLPSQVSPNPRTVLVPTAGSDVSVISPRNLRSTRRRRWLGKSARPHPCYTGLLKSALTLVEDTCSRPGCTTPAPDPDNWWKCPRDGSPCKWLALENNKTPKSLAATGSERKVLPNPNVPVANYKYPFDTWVTTWPDDDLEIYIKGEKVRPQASGTSYLIPEHLATMYTTSPRAERRSSSTVPAPQTRRARARRSCHGRKAKP
ncbi:hypothetical protein VFPBJ_10791 [Purpureocillium lilacinum]|uniref:Uncharacterized protein n=1 Tax=Purpureocillium lilacinum TaxID=33203 RepID=A0A179FUS5_PURLI|nr:hypothetical protein VFPBJ_10791 [Purpureocillium lilacinum]